MWTRLGLRSTSLGPTSLGSPSLHPPRLWSQSLKSHETLEQIRDWPPEASGHADGGENRFSDDSYSEGELLKGGNVYQCGGTKLPPAPMARK